MKEALSAYEGEHMEENETRPPKECPVIENVRETCFLLRDWRRPVFLEEIDHFISSATSDELAKLREAIAARAKNLKSRPGRRGRPSSDRDEKQRRRNCNVAIQRHVMGWDWKRIAEAEGLEPTKENCRTIERRRNAYAAVVWDALQDVLCRSDPSLERIRLALKDLKTRQWLQSRAGLPFRDAPEQCEALVEALAPFGRKESGKEFGRRFDYLVKKRAAGSSVK
jgi:hypothetical protein